MTRILCRVQGRSFQAWRGCCLLATRLCSGDLIRACFRLVSVHFSLVLLLLLLVLVLLLLLLLLLLQGWVKRARPSAVKTDDRLSAVDISATHPRRNTLSLVVRLGGFVTSIEEETVRVLRLPTTYSVNDSFARAVCLFCFTRKDVSFCSPSVWFLRRFCVFFRPARVLSPTMRHNFNNVLVALE